MTAALSAVTRERLRRFTRIAAIIGACVGALYAVAMAGRGGRTLDDSSAHATLNDGPLTLKLLFRFNAEGLIDTVGAEARDRVVDGKTVTAPWQGRYWRNAMHDGMRVPQEGEVAWVLPEGDKPYWRGKTLSATYEFANSPAQ